MPSLWHLTVLILCCLFIAPPVQGQLTAFQCAQENSRLAWVWFGGAVANYSSAINAPSNVWPEPRDNAASWQLGNKLYILGGKNFTLGLRDFWEYDTTTYQWCLLDSKVSEAVGAIYSAYSAANTSHLFLYGGFQMNEYFTAAEALLTIPISSLIPQSNITWQMLHPLNASSIDYNQLLITPIDSLLPNPQFNETPSESLSPGPRYAGSTWMVGSDLYIFGGLFKVMTGPRMADLWKWNTQRNDGWAFVAGSTIPDDTAASGSYPSARSFSTSWTVGSDLFLFGGQSSLSENNDLLNDLWRFDTVTLVWEQISPLGDSIPPQKRSAMAFQTAGKLWLYGGNEYGSFNDLYYYDIAMNQWVTVMSSNWNITAPVYGERGAPNDVDALNPNTPSFRSSAAAFTLNDPTLDADPKFWLFSGYPGSYTAETNDLWALKCYQTKPCGPFPLGNQTDTLVGECNGAEWIIPGDGNQSITTTLNISIPISIVGNISIISMETIIAPFGNQSAISVSGCANVSLGTVVIDRNLFKNTSIVPVLSGDCILGFSIDNITLTGPEPKCGDEIRIKQSQQQVAVLLHPRSCGRLSRAVIIGVSVGGCALVAVLATAGVLLTKKYLRPKKLSTKEQRKRIGVMQQETQAVV